MHATSRSALCFCKSGLGGPTDQSHMRLVLQMTQRALRLQRNLKAFAIVLEVLLLQPYLEERLITVQTDHDVRKCIPKLTDFIEGCAEVTTIISFQNRRHSTHGCEASCSWSFSTTENYWNRSDHVRRRDIGIERHRLDPPNEETIVMYIQDYDILNEEVLIRRTEKHAIVILMESKLYNLAITTHDFREKQAKDLHCCQASSTVEPPDQRLVTTVMPFWFVLQPSPGV